MIDIKLLRENAEMLRQNCIRRGYPIDMDGLIKLDNDCRTLGSEIEALRQERNRLSKECAKDPAAREQVKQIKLQLGEELDILDIARGSKVAQTGFYYWKGKGAMLAQAFFFWVQKFLVERGFTMFMTPCAAKERTLFGTGYLPFFADQTYNLTGEDLALIGTSEQTLVGYHADDVLDGAKLPLCYTAFTPCFRTESGSYGRASRGIFRVHQFHKVEQIVFCKPEESEKYHEFCLENEEALLQALGLPYHVVNVCVGDLGAPGYKKYDIEAYFPSFGGYREVTSNTNLTSFQSRRLNIRYKDGDTRDYVHTISATAATDRMIICIMENFQQPDGSIVVPEVLRPYTGFDVITK